MDVGKVGRDRRGRTIEAIAASFFVAIILTLPFFLTTPRRESFCSAPLAVTTVDGHRVALQDQGAPGRDGCELPRIGTKDFDVLGLDCRVRTNKNVVVASTTPNRSDGTCGQPGPFDAQPG